MALLISHRFSTVRMADRIVVLENGRIAEQGSHAAADLPGRTIRRHVRTAGRELPMIHENVSLQEPQQGEIESGPWRRFATRDAALSRAHPDSRPRARKRRRPPDRRRRVRALIARVGCRPVRVRTQRWVIDNFRLIYSTRRKSRENSRSICAGTGTNHRRPFRR